eukprot:1160391-Pelagomonas_calceolata.AAC.1
MRILGARPLQQHSAPCPRALHNTQTAHLLKPKPGTDACSPSHDGMKLTMNWHTHSRHQQVMIKSASVEVTFCTSAVCTRSCDCPL